MDPVSSVKEFIRKQVPDWDDEIMATARFKAFSGQRSDWEPKYLFWKDLILKIARHLDLFIIRPSQVKEEWFNRGGLTPLCLDHVLCLMYNEGDIVRNVDLVDPSSGRLSQLFRKVRNLMVRSPVTPEIVMLEDHLFLTPLLKDKTAQIIKCLSESHWTSSCIITMSKFQGMCGGPFEAAPLLSYLSGLGKALYFSISKEVMEGVKISLSSESVPAISSLDLDVLHLIWTTQKLEDQIDVIDRRYEMSRKSALASLNSGNKKVALRHAREMKLTSQSRERCTSLLNRVEEVLHVIANAESHVRTQSGSRASFVFRSGKHRFSLPGHRLTDETKSQPWKAFNTPLFVGLLTWLFGLHDLHQSGTIITHQSNNACFTLQRRLLELCLSNLSMSSFFTPHRMLS